MAGIWAALMLFVEVMNAGRTAWVEPLPGVQIAPTRPVRHEQDLGPDSAYGLLCRAGELSFEEVDGAEGWDMAMGRLDEHPLPKGEPKEFADDGPWATKDHMALLLAVDYGAPNLKLVRLAIAAPDPQMPTADSPAYLLPYLAPTRQLARLLAVSAYVKEADGDLAGAMDDLLVCIRWGNLVSRGGPLINHLVDIAISCIGVNGMNRIVMRNDMPPGLLRGTARELLVIADQVEPFAEAMRYEANVSMACIDLAHRAGPASVLGGNPGLGQLLTMHLSEPLSGSSPKAMKRDFTYLYQHLVNLSEKPYTQEKSQQMASLVGNLKPQVPTAMLGKKDPVGLILASMLVPGLSQANSKGAERDAYLRGMAIYLAVLAYEKQTGAPPQALADLVPDYLPRVPVDPFGGGPFHYRVGQVPAEWGESTWGIYSVGRNFRDDGGSAGALVSSRAPGRPVKECPDILWLPKPLPVPPGK